MADTMSWSWIGIALILPFGIGLLIAWPFWGRSRDSLGGAVASIFILGFTLAFVGREYVHVQRLTQACIAAETRCVFSPEPFTRFGIYALIGMLQVGAVFAIGAAVEHRIENASFAREWRR